MCLSKVLLQIACPECLILAIYGLVKAQYMPVAITIGLGINQMWVLNASQPWANYLTSLSLTLSLGRVSNSLLHLKIKCSICQVLSTVAGIQ